MDNIEKKHVTEDVWPIGKKSAYFTLIICMVLGVFDLMDRLIIVSLFPYLKAEYTLSDTQLGMLVSILNFAVAVLVIPGAYIIDRWSRTKTLALMTLIWSLATGAGAFVGTYSHLLIARFIVGAGEAGYNPAGQALLSACFPKRLRSTVIAALQFAMGLGAPLGLVVGAYIATHWGWRHAFGVVAIPGFFAALLALKMKDFKTAETSENKTAKMPYTVVLKKIFTTPTLPLVFCAQAMSAM